MNILTIDLEDWFHILANDATASPAQWEKFESRIERNADWILDQLAQHQCRATFFCLGWIAQRHPALVKKISRQGHEVASHSMNHQLVYSQSPLEFKADLQECLHLLEDITGTRIKTYRAPGFSVSEKTNWVFDILIESGIENDCSVFPANRNHGGYRNFLSSEPCIISMNGRQLKEFPVSLSHFAGKGFVYSGGGYFRLLPYPLIKKLMRRQAYVMTYFHPRDFDEGQPVLESLTAKRRLMSYVGLQRAKKKFGQLLIDFEFTNVEGAAQKIAWNRCKVIPLH